MTVVVNPRTEGKQARGFIYCDKPQDMGRIPVDLSVLERWKLSSRTLAQSLARLLNLAESVLRWSADGTRCTLGALRAHPHLGEITFVLDSEMSLKFAGVRLPLIHALKLHEGRLRLSSATLLRHATHKHVQPRSGVGSVAWRSQRARDAAIARHRQPGGTIDKQKKIRAEWATGKYRTRDDCAESVGRKIGLSFSAARKALRNTPEPKPT